MKTTKGRTGKSCAIAKKCAVCLQTKPNLEFDSNGRERTRLKPHCKECAPIYEGIKMGLLPAEAYLGLKFDASSLRADFYGKISFFSEEGHERINVEDARQLVRQGAAHMISESAIEALISKVTGNLTLRDYIIQRDKSVCHYCGARAHTIDHVIPQFRGGLDTPLNLVSACGRCNLLKDHMSKATFLKKKKAGTLDESLLTMDWETRLKVNPPKKKCATCGVVRPAYEFEKQKISCFGCAKLAPALELGLIGKKRLRIANFNAKALVWSRVDVWMKDNSLMCFVRKEKAQQIVSHGFAEVLDGKTIRLLFTGQEMRRVSPHSTIEAFFEPENAEESKQLRIIRQKLFGASPREKEAPVQLEQSSYPLFSEGQFLFIVQKRDAEEMLRNGHAKTAEKRLELSISVDEGREKYELLFKKAKVS